MRPSMMRPGIHDRVSLRREARQWRALIGLLGANLMAALIGSLASPTLSPRAAAWYAALRKPGWTPPDAIFGVVWPLLYVLSAVAAWQVWRRRHSHRAEVALGFYFLQLALNAAWSPVFFGLRSPGGALLLLLLLLATLGFTIRAFAGVRRSAAVMLAPYFAWVAFAGLLNLSIWWLNR